MENAGPAAYTDSSRFFMPEDSQPTPEAAVAILHAKAPEESILLIRRTTNARDPWSGQWAFPGGRRDAGDRDLLDTALRELHEECGIGLNRADLTQRLPYEWAGRRVGRKLWVAPFGFVLPEILPVNVNPEEAAQAAWVPVRVLADTARHTRVTIAGLPSGVQWPAIELDHVPLWGFTYRLVCQWIGLNVEGA
ncbi:MAG: putative Nudix hydrolase NudL [Bryobacteraceae bacterium]|nr:putative Nudix hydrolase NudL [Bryobacteraceae bacterium]